MNVLLCDNKKIDIFILPKKIKEYFTINYYYDLNYNCETINFSAENDSWKLLSNVNMKINSNNQSKDIIILKEYDNYNLYFADLDINVKMIVLPDFEEYIDVDYGTLNNILIGSLPNNNIILNTQNIEANHASIEKINGAFYLKNISGNNTPIYVNKKRVNNIPLNLGDVIYIGLIKIIWMGNFLKINNPNKAVQLMNLRQIQPSKMKTTDYTPVTETERNIKLFTDDKAFFHTPRIQSKIKFEKIEIDDPPAPDTTQRMPRMLTMGSSVMMGLMSFMTVISTFQSIAAGTIDKLTAALQLIIGFLMLAVSVFLPVLTDIWERKMDKKNEKNRVDRYRKYLNEKAEYIKKVINTQESIMHESNLTLKEIRKRIENNSTSLWSREILDDDFLTVRLGTGNIPAEIEISAPTERFNLYDDVLIDELHKITNSTNEMQNVPITISMVKNKVTPFIISSKFKQEFINNILLQIMFYYSSMDLKIVLFTNEFNEDKWDYIKYLPHCWSDNHEKRFFASSEDEIFQVSSDLEQIYNKRLDSSKESSDFDKATEDNKAELYKNFTEYYLIITDDFNSIKKSSIVKKILDSNNNLGFSLLIFEDSLQNLPSRLEKFVDIEDNFSAIYSKENDSRTKFIPETAENINMREYAKVISNIPIQIASSEGKLPNSLNFLEMYNAGRIDHLNIIQRWHDNNPTISLSAPLGVKTDGKLITLDLHEKYHGPHGLIAGTTGSGKSEFIITYVLSMAINYSPEEVQFVLIDYKGGGLAGAFENREKGIKIPHLVGTITNLDKSEMNRTLVSINSELQRRQIKFNEARDMLDEGTIDIYKYQNLYRSGKVKEPISHLFIICDEFAELKQQQPEFMEELISTSRIGRSLGVHLILATQKPSGVVDDQIWSNSKFKVCLKVQTAIDSNEMLKKPDAAYIKQSGRFYLQVGNDEIFELGQSAWAGAKYTPVDRLLSKIDDSINIVDNNGNIIKSIKDEIKQEDNIDYGDQLSNIVKYLHDLALRENYRFNNLWLPSLSPELFLPNLVKKYNYKTEKYKYDAVIGEYDKPTKQLQGLYTIDINCKNTIIFGMPNSGKENYLSVLLYSLAIYHSPSEINFYIIDMGSESLRVMNKLPHVGDFITINELEKVSTEFDFLEKEIKKRKELFADYSGSFIEYCKSSDKKVPLIVTMLNAYESFMENCPDYDAQLNHLLREGSKYGIVFITTLVSTNSIRSSTLEYYSNKVLLQVNDAFDYQYILGAPSGTIPKKVFGRGIGVVDEEICEFQTSFINIKDNINNVVKASAKALVEHYKESAPEIKIIPKVIKLDSLFKYAKNLNKIPVGYSRDSVELTYFDFTKNKTNLIIGNEATEKIDFMCSIIDLLDSIQDIKLNIFDYISSIQTDGNASYYNIRFVEAFNEVILNKNKEYTVNIIIGLGNLFEVLDDTEREQFDVIMNNIDKFTNQTFIIFDDLDRIKKVSDKEWFKSLNTNSGIWVGNDIDEQDIFKLNNLANYDIEEDMKQLIYVIDNYNYTVVKGVGGKDEEEEVSMFGF